MSSYQEWLDFVLVDSRFGICHCASTYNIYCAGFAFWQIKMVTVKGYVTCLYIPNALVTRNRITDERDRLIELRGYRAGYLTIASLMVCGLGMLWLHVAVGHLSMDSRMWGLHFLSVYFGILVISDITKTATQIVAYKRAL